MTAPGYLSDWAARVAELYLATTLPQRWAHVLGCRRQAQRIGPRLLARTERELLVAAALLHDVGYAKPLVRSGFHPLDGALFLSGVGVPPRLCNLVAHHSAAAVTAGLRGLGAELGAFSDEHTALRDALWFCDMTTDPSGREVTAEERIADIRLRYGPGSVQVRALDSGGLTARIAAVRRTDQRLRTASSLTART
jgi:hypothetical protein